MESGKETESDAASTSGSPGQAHGQTSTLDGLLREAYSANYEFVADLEPTARRRFEVLTSLGRGGMGEVFLARDRSLDRRVALKVIRPELRTNREARARFLREARILSRFEHPNLCRIHDHIEGARSDLLVLEYIKGEPLGQCLERGLSSKESLRIASGLASALSVAHGAGVVHRDLKPSNILVAAGDVPRILDFGVARWAKSARAEIAGLENSSAWISGPDSGQRDRTEQGRLMGTREYMSPESLKGEEATPASDMYALGLIYTQLFGGQLVVPAGEAESLSAAGAELGGVPRDVQRLVRQMLSQEAHGRPDASTVALWMSRRLGRARRLAGLAVAAAVLLFAVWGVLTYLHDVGLERDRALAREAQAVRLVEFLVADVASRVEQVGPPVLMEQIDLEAMRYFESDSRIEFTETEVRRRIQALGGIARRERQRGRLETARRSWMSLADTLSVRLATDPSSEEWLFELGQVHFYLGEIARDAMDPTRVREHWGRYASISRSLVDRFPGDVRYSDEAAYAATNLAVQDLESGDGGSALAAFREVATYWSQRSGEMPESADLELEVADAISWRAQAKLATGSVDAAMDDFALVAETWEGLLSRDPDHVNYAHGLALARHSQATCALMSGRSRLAIAWGERAVAIARRLLARDQERGDWGRSLGLALSTLAIARAADGQSDAALLAHNEACVRARELLERDPGNSDWLLLAVSVMLRKAEHLKAAGREDEARSAVAWMSDRLSSTTVLGRDLRLVTAQVELLKGDLGGGLPAHYDKAALLLATCLEEGPGVHGCRDTDEVALKVALRQGDDDVALAAIGRARSWGRLPRALESEIIAWRRERTLTSLSSE